MKSVIISIFVSLLYTRLTAGGWIPPRPASVISPNSTTLADNSDTAHCSSDHASYGQFPLGTVACILAAYELLQSPKLTTLPSMYPIDFVSSTAPLPAEGNGLPTPWRSTYGECTVAIALLSEVPARYTPEVPATPSGQSAIVFKGSLEQAEIGLETCFKPPQGTNIGWAEVRGSPLGGDGKVGIFAFKKGSPIDRALPDGPRISNSLSSDLAADLTVA